MKKFLLSAMAFVATMSANAQVFQMDAEAQGLSSDLSDVDAGKAWGSIEGAIQISNAFATQHKAVDCKNDDYTKVIIDGNEILTKGGIQGNDNPKDADGTGVGASLSAPVSGAVIALTAEKDGWVYIVSKLSTNKQYVVFEEGLPIGYKIAMENVDARVADGVLAVEFKGEGEFNNLSKDMEEYKDGIPWLIRKYLNEPEAESAGNGLGVFYFPVAAGCNYYASASGSKISWCGIYFSEKEATSVSLEGEGIAKALIGEGGNVPPVEEKVYSVIGTLVGGWDVVNDVDMQLVNGLYSATIEIAEAGSYEYKIRQDHEWAINWGDNGDGTGVQDGPNFKAELPANSSITITFDPATAKIDAYVAGGALPEPGGDVDIWVSDGSKGAISWSSDYRFASDEKKTGEEIYAVPMDVWEKMKTTPFFLDLEGENPQIRVTTGWWDSDATYTGNDITPGSELLTDNGDGKWTLKVDLSATQALLDLVDDHHLLFTGDRYTPVKLYFSDTTAIKTVKAAKKFDGATYNLAGQKVNASYRGVVIKNGKKFIQK